MKTNTTYARFSLWGLAALTFVIAGGMLARRGIAQERPMFISGTDVPAADKAGNPGRTIQQMREVYEIMKANDWGADKVPFALQRLEDQKFEERPHRRDARVGGIAFPRLALYSDVACYVDTYFRRNLVIYSHNVVSHPEGYFLVMFKSGQLVKVKPEDVRMYPHPTIPDGMVPVFPGMKVYKPDLPKMDLYQ